jgi:ABC-type transport system involved in multi-copper enzyme maturation permease subunit
VTRLIRVEILRLSSRRLVRIIGVLVLLLVAVIVTIDGSNSSNDTSAEITRFNQQRLAGYDQARAGFERDQQAGHIPPDATFPTRAEAEADPQQCFPDPDTAEPFNCTPPKQPYAITTKLPEFGRAVAVICAIVAFLIGASAAGAEWAAGTMQSLLYWEPRRIRVVAAKILGLLVVTATVVVAAEALFTAAALLAAQTRGTTAGLTSDVWTSHLLLVLRGIGIAAFAGILGFAIAFGTRVTAAAVAVGFIYFAVLEQLLVVWKPWLGRYLIGPLLDGWLNWGFHAETGDTRPLTLSGQRAGITLTLYAAAILAAATVWFRQRDVT